MMDIRFNKRLDDARGVLDNTLITNENFLAPGGGRVAMDSTDPAVFNRLCGPLISGTADPADRSFAIQVHLAAKMASISATFSRQIRHIASPRDIHSPSVILIFPIEGAVSLRIGGALHPLYLALISSDTDFDVRPDRPGDTCSVACIALTTAPDLAMLIPQPLIVSSEARGDVWPEALRLLGTQAIDRIRHSTSNGSYSVARDAARLGEMIREHLRSRTWQSRSSCEAASVPPRRDIVAAVQRYLRDHNGDAELTPARLARHCAVSVRKLYNAFAGVEMSLRATVLSYRLDEARRQLHSRTVKKVTSISFDTGFRDVSTFYRNFRREFGYSPRSSCDVPPAEANEVDGQATDWARPLRKRVQLGPDHQKPCALVREGFDANRLSSPHNAALGSAHLPRNALFRNHATRGRKLPRPEADKSRPR